MTRTAPLHAPRRHSLRPSRVAAARIDRLEARSLLATIAVTTLADDGAGSLRQAIVDATAGDTLDLTGLSGTITLASELAIEKDLTLIGPGMNHLAISGNDAVRVFAQSECDVAVSDLTIRDGEGGNGFGGGWRMESGSAAFTRVRFSGNHAGQGGALAAIAYDDDHFSITIDESIFTDNSATSSNTAAGGAICLYALDGTDTSARGQLDFEMTDSLLASNTASGTLLAVGGGIYARASSGLDGYPGGILNVTLRNSTIANNAAVVGNSNGAIARGGGLHFESVGAEQDLANDAAFDLTLVNNTVARNRTTIGTGANASAAGAGMLLAATRLMGSGFAVTAVNNLIAGNTGSHDIAQIADGAITWTNHRHNLVGTTSHTPAIVHGVNGDLRGVDPKLGTLADHGGTTQTIRIPYNSPARDAGDDAFAPATDQRGVARVGTSDIGAYEWTNTAPVWTTTSLDNAVAGKAYLKPISASDVDTGQTLTYTLIDAPPFFELIDTGAGGIKLSGSPSADDVGTFTLTLRVSDGVDQSDITLGIAVIANAAPVWLTSALPSAVSSVPYSTALTATDANSSDSLTYSIVSGPSFLRIRNESDRTATLYGTPTLSDVGTHNVVLKVSDPIESTTLQLTITVAAPLAQVENGTLYINGTNGDDVISALLSNSTTIRVTRGSAVQTFALSTVSKIVVSGFGGNDDLKAQVNYLPVTILGGDGNDTIRGGGGYDKLYGDAGNDYIDAGAGRNTVYGGVGEDTLIGGNSADRLSGEDGADLIQGRGGPDYLYGGAGNDYIDAGSGRNKAYGGADNDTLVGGNSIDRLNGDAGNDSLIGNRGKDYLSGGDGYDIARIDASDILDSIEVTG